MNWRWISIAALLAALVVGYGALSGRSPVRVVSSEPPAHPGYYLQDAVITQTQENGSPGMRLTASRIEQHPQNDSIDMSAVRVNYFQAPGKEWILTARQGHVPANSRILELQGDVQLRPADAPQTSFLRTSALAIDTDTNVAYSTSSPVSIKLGRHAMTVTSFTADLDSEKIRVESANGRFEPQ